MTFIVTTQPEETIGDDDWWQTAVIYQIYTKSFQDSDGDGVGDLQGIISRLSYLEETGVTGFSLTPIYPSPQIDGGYDISNFTGIDPLFGTFEDFQELVAAAHEKNLKMILDFVPNHSSDEHIWFQNSVAQIEPYTDYYVWRNGVISDGVVQPPNNWLSVFGGSAWTWNDQRQQYYLHQFHARQPDLNFRSSDLVTEITDVLRFWLDQGVDGFRISAVAHLFENESFPNEPVKEDTDSSVLESDYEYLRHIYTTDLDETINTVYQWRNVVDDYAAQSDRKTRILITDSTANRDVVARYFGNGTNQGAHLPLNFGIITNLTRLSLASTYISTFNEWSDLASSQNRTLNWILGNHDYGRIASRFALNRADGLNMLLLLPGTAFTYMGEELALLDTELSFNETQDPYAINAGADRFELFTRDPARTPYHWDNSTSGGFSTNVSTWLPINENYLTRNLAVQIAAERSNYQTYKTILELKKTNTIKRGDTHFLALSNDRVLAFIRELEAETTYAVVINLGLSTVNVDLSEFSNLLSRDIEVCLTSSNAIITAGTIVDITAISLSANAAVVLCDAEISETTTEIITSTAVTSGNTTGSTTESATTPISTTTTTNQSTSTAPSNSTESTTEPTTTPISTTATTNQSTSATPGNSTESTTGPTTTPISTTATTNQSTSATPGNSTESTTGPTTTPISTTATTNQSTSATPGNSTESTTGPTTTPISTTATTNQSTSATPGNSTESTTGPTTTPISTTATTNQSTSATPGNSTESTTGPTTTPISTTATTNQSTSATPGNSTESTTGPTTTPISTTETTNQSTSATPGNSTESTTGPTTTPISTTATTNQSTSATPGNSTESTTGPTTTPISTTATTNQSTSATPGNSTESTTGPTTTPISTTATTNQSTSATPGNSTESTTGPTTTPISTTATTNQSTSATPGNSTESTTGPTTTPISTTATTNQSTSATPGNSTESTTGPTTTPISTTATTNQSTSATPGNSTESTIEPTTTPISTTATTNQSTSATPSNSTESTTEPGPEPDTDASGSDASTAYISSVLVITTLYSITLSISSLRI